MQNHNSSKILLAGIVSLAVQLSDIFGLAEPIGTSIPTWLSVIGIDLQEDIVNTLENEYMSGFANPAGALSLHHTAL